MRIDTFYTGIVGPFDDRINRAIKGTKMYNNGTGTMLIVASKWVDQLLFKQSEKIQNFVTDMASK